MTVFTNVTGSETELSDVLVEARMRASENGKILDRSGTRAKILASAIEMFAERGFEACSVRDLAKSVGIKAPGLYSHFPSKEAILSEAMIQALVDFHDFMGVPSASLTPLERLEETVRRHVLFQIEHLAVARANDVLLDSEAVGRFLDEADHDLLIRTQRGYHYVVRARIEAAVPDFELDFRITTFAVLNLCDHVTAWYRPTGELSADEIAEQYWQLVRGLLRVAD